MTIHTDHMHQLTQEEIDDLMRQAEDLHAIHIVWVIVILIAIVSLFMLFGEASGASLAAFGLPLSACNGNCRQGRDCRCSPMEQRTGGAAVDTSQLLATGAMTGPHRHTRPITLTLRQRLVRWIRGAL